ncbi:ribonuclease domain-containing protein [Arthrobacter sp. U41]|uniref:ribonuclease domain-containing protein n=1 Tax=Arthrobacter sp. U41 TaxID=1849032 RepID=UPI0008594A96|nr:ribonuclease domain-containing protein [Arthrobacter sp. U41]AOT03485.1 ribonuclease [Arthrobacter sp. U41]
MKPQRLTALLALLIGLAVLALVLAGVPLTGTAPPGTAPAGASPTSMSQPSAARRGAPAAPRSIANASGLPEVRASELPAEARQTLALIARGGPYPYTRDDVTFGNFERLLPRKSSGYYKEYTVRTPGESDRGARRIVAGQAGEKYYTPDHYNSFKFIVEGK